MEKKTKNYKPVTTAEENKDYLFQLFEMVKDLRLASNTQRDERFNQTEVRLMTEIVYAKSKGERLISTQLASRLGVTRSAVSQIVNRLEEEKVIVRLPDEVDKKIAYVELSEEMETKFAEVIDKYSAFVGKVVAAFGKRRLEKMLSLIREFSQTVGELCDCE
ncbi:MAG: MarR family transcriptional regulator [Clostridia bacterium]|nr:MarR family transcriptional regulator [Clostridia bacterium]